MVQNNRKGIGIALAVGIAWASIPALAFEAWLAGVVEQQQRAEADAVATRVLARAEQNFDKVAEELKRTLDRGLARCDGATLAALREAAFALSPVKDFAVVGPAGETLCSAGGLSMAGGKAAASLRLPPDNRLTLDVLRLPNRRDAVLQLGLRGIDGRPGLAALIPGELLPGAGSDPAGGDLDAVLRVRNAPLTGAEAPTPAPVADDNVNGTARGDRYGLSATVTLPRARLQANGAGQRIIAFTVLAAIAVVFVGAALLLGARWRRRAPAAALASAIARGEIVAHYQPVLDITTGRLRGGEVLARWQKPDGTLVPPNDFIPLAEQYGQMAALTRALMRRVCDELGPALAARPHQSLGFNVPATLFTADGIVRDIDEIFANSPIGSSQLVIELTETPPVADFGVAATASQALRRRGIRVALDDLGTGHNGLAHLLKLGVDIVKLDKILIDALGVGDNAALMIDALVRLAGQMRIEVTAEGVETVEQVEALRALGVTAAQGYVFAPGLPANAYLALMNILDALPAAAPPPQDEQQEDPAADIFELPVGEAA